MATRKKAASPATPVAQTVSAAPAVVPNMPPKLLISDIEAGDVFSEIRHYSFIKKEGPNAYVFKAEGNEEITLTEKYVKELLETADQYFSEVKVTREDKHDGTLGIRSIWENISDSHVFTVEYITQDKAKTKKALEEERTKQLEEYVAEVSSAALNKKGVERAARIAMEKLQNNPISPVIPGALRTLRGYKIQSVSRDGRYNCIDMDKPEGDNIRPVNILTIQSLVYKGVKYVVVK